MTDNPTPDNASASGADDKKKAAAAAQEATLQDIGEIGKAANPTSEQPKVDIRQPQHLADVTLTGIAKDEVEALTLAKLVREGQKEPTAQQQSQQASQPSKPVDEGCCGVKGGFFGSIMRSIRSIFKK